ncbi:MAG: NAD(+) synthase [Anaerolineaceae bacterium]
MKTDSIPFSKEALNLDEGAEVERIIKMMRQTVLQRFHRQGAVVGISGGVDSAVVLALSTVAFGSERVVGIMMPEKESSDESVRLAQEQADLLGVRTVTEDITSSLIGSGCYRRRDDAVRRLFPQFGEGWSLKIVLPNDLLEQGTLNVFQLVLHDPQGIEYRKRLPVQEFRQIVAASNFKQRARMSMLYYHAELKNYAVIGTANKNEHDLGFFVKYGDGGCDVNPIAHLFKTQVYHLAEYLGVMEEIQKRTPTTDTYPGAGSQEEFFYRIPFELLDTIWMGYEMEIPEAQLAQSADLQAGQVERVIRDIASKKRTTEYLRAPVIDFNNRE